jgi:hypothetical protein
MSRVLKKITEHQKEIEEGGPTISLSYSTMVSEDLIKPYSIRLPVTTLAMLDDIIAYGPWDSKQEAYYEILNDFIHEYIDSPETSDYQKKTCLEAADKALEEWKIRRQEAAA